GACVAADDFDGPHGAAIRNWQALGFVAREPSADPAPSCPHCGEGTPCSLGGRVLCNACHSAADARDLWLWSFDAGRFLQWLAAEAGLRGGVRRLDAGTWQLGTWATDEERVEFFFRAGGSQSELGRTRISAYRRALIVFGRTRPAGAIPGDAPCVSLLELVRSENGLSVVPLSEAFEPNERVRFDAGTGGLWLGTELLGEVPHGSKEYHFLQRLAADLDKFVAYPDLKRDVLSRSGSRDTTDEATFCQKLKSRIKAKWVPRIDELLVTTNKGDGYRLRAELSRSQTPWQRDDRRNTR
ncbi:MAG: hypothetical protein ACSLE1_02670, partial [Sphingobium sp.]